MTKDLNCCATFYPHCCVIHDSFGMVREICKEEEGLYTMFSHAGIRGQTLTNVMQYTMRQMLVFGIKDYVMFLWKFLKDTYVSRS